MIIIIRALSQVRNKKKKGHKKRRSKKKRKAIKKEKAQKNKGHKKREGQKNERKREKGQCYYPFTTLVLQSSTMIFIVESL